MATKENKAAKQPEKKPRGRPSKYKEEYDEQARKLCLLGATDKELADFFLVNEDSINEWKKKHPSFSESLKKGKVVADSEVVDRLYQRAMGYSHAHSEFKVVGGKVVEIKTIKHYPPDPVSGIFLLKNRQPDKFRDKQIQEHQIGEETKAIFKLNSGVEVEL